jgi:hypothetical protein
MPINRFLKDTTLGPEEVGCLNRAYETALKCLCLVDRNDPIAEMVAQKIIEIGQSGIRDPGLISARAVKELGIQ